MLSSMNVQFTPETNDALMRLTKTLGTSKAGVLRYGVSALLLIMKAQRDGGELAVVKDGKVVREIEPLWPMPV